MRAQLLVAAPNALVCSSGWLFAGVRSLFMARGRPNPRAALAALAVLATPELARAYCQTYTCEFDPRETCGLEPVTGCRWGGQVARWAGGCFTYAVQEDGSVEQGISADELRQVLDAVCEGRGPGVMTPMLAATYRGTTRCDAVEYNCGAEYNDNIVMFRDTESELSANTIALSSIIANLTTGEILDVDIELNSRDFQFSTDAAEVSAGAHDLRLVINHELGHLLGLSHSRDEGALMHAEYEGASQLPGRDDARGICNVFPVSDTDPECSAPAIEGGGSCVGSVGACRIVLKPEPAPECAFRAPAAPGREGSAPVGGVLLSALGLGLLRRCRRAAAR
jgi:hypothetical protein